MAAPATKAGLGRAGVPGGGYWIILEHSEGIFGIGNAAMYIYVDDKDDVDTEHSEGIFGTDF